MNANAGSAANNSYSTVLSDDDEDAPVPFPYFLAAPPPQLSTHQQGQGFASDRSHQDGTGIMPGMSMAPQRPPEHGNYSDARQHVGGMSSANSVTYSAVPAGRDRDAVITIEQEDFSSAPSQDEQPSLTHITSSSGHRSNLADDSQASSSQSSGGETGSARTAGKSPISPMETAMPVPSNPLQNVDELVTRVFPGSGSSYVRRSSVDGQCVYLAHNADWIEEDHERHDQSMESMETNTKFSDRARTTIRIMSLTHDGRLARRSSKCTIQ